MVLSQLLFCLSELWSLVFGLFFGYLSRSRQFLARIIPRAGRWSRPCTIAFTSLDCTTHPRLDLIFSKQLEILSLLMPRLQSSIKIVRKPRSWAWKAVEATQTSVAMPQT